MSDSAMADVQTAIYTLLAGDATLSNLIAPGAVVDSMPEEAPDTVYVVLGESNETPDNTFGAFGRSELFPVHAFAEDTGDRSGWKTVKDINSRVVALLDGAALSVSGRSTVLCHLEASQSIHDPPWRHIATDFRIQTET